LDRKPYYALWSYKIHCSERLDLLGNSLAIISGLASILAFLSTRVLEFLSSFILKSFLTRNELVRFGPASAHARHYRIEIIRARLFHSGATFRAHFCVASTQG